MKRPYTRESWTRFKTLLQKLTKRTAIVETRAQNNEDRIDEIEPKVEELEDFAENVNDETTGINLLPGSRDFRKNDGIQKFGIHPVNGWDIGLTRNDVSVHKDKDGFSIGTINRTSGGVNTYGFSVAILDEFKNGDYVTYSFEFMTDNASTFNGTTIAQIGIVDKNTNLFVSGTVGNVVLSSHIDSLESNKWYKIVYHHKLTLDKTDDIAILVYLSCSGNGNYNYKKPALNFGKINNPIWSSAPSDLVLEPNNDITTGINLLRGTRDFTSGSIKHSTMNYYLDGFYNIGTWAIRTPDEDGFIAIGNSGNAESFFSSVFHAKQGEFITISLDINTKEVPTQDCFIQVNAIEGTTAKTLYTVHLQTIVKLVSGECTQACIQYLIPNTTATEFFLGIRHPGKNQVELKKFMVQRGHIEHPEWSASPFDIDVINDITTGINLLRGTRDWTIHVGTSTPNNTEGFTYNASNYEVSKDLDGRSIITFNKSLSTPSYINTSVVREFKQGQSYTLFYEVMFHEYPGAINLFGYAHRNSSNVSKRSANYSVSNLGEIELNKWYKVVFPFVISDTVDPGDYLFFAIALTKANLSLRPLCLYEGNIEHPEWSVSPLDVANSYDFTSLINSAPLLLGNISSRIALNTDLNDYVVPGMYSISYTDATKNTVLNMPVKDGGTLIVTRTNGGATSLLRQIFTIQSEPATEYIRFTSDNGTTWSDWRQTYANTTVRPIEGGGTGGDTADKARKNLKVLENLGNDLTGSTTNDTYDFWLNKPSGLYFNGKGKLNGQPSNYGYNLNLVRSEDILQLWIPTNEKSSLHSQMGYRFANAENKGTKMNNYIRIIDEKHYPYNPGIYEGLSIATKFSSEIGTNHIANWLSSRVSQGNFEGLNIGDWVDIPCTGATRRYVIGAIDQYYNLGSPTRMGHHLVMIPLETWKLTASRDGSYAVGTNNNYIKWSITDNNGNQTEPSPYLASNLHKWETDVALAQFPQEWQDVMLDFTAFIETRYSASSTLNSSNGGKWDNLGKIWSPSIIEVFGDVRGVSYPATKFGSQFPIFSKLSNVRKVTSFWLRDTKDSSSSNAMSASYLGGVVDSLVTSEGSCPYPCFLLG